MSKIKTFNVAGDAAGEVEFDDALLVLDKGDQAVKDVVVATLAAQRAGTASTLSKGEVAGSNKKPWKQKGTGRARAGFRQSPVWRGGGIAMGPKPRDYSIKINKKVVDLAFRHAVSCQIADEKLVVINELPSDGKTKTVAALAGKICEKGAVLFLVTEGEYKFDQAVRNIPTAYCLTAESVDVYAIVDAAAIVCSAAALEVVKNRMKGKPEVAA